ncbi:MAG: aminotransferase class V-fold PLP-dependent enzyme [Oscillospiraceae bacterium]|jgi:cysteine desulfurase family protein|nr:aminotransferase class V-fold PLP-dependent enzyme [Oscillospiraceae bacterium]MCI1990878.1 aminotransferase class V-fold PLP-dependent enzyme [Oscillospiraceae bacterium]MCI2036043.1 aminotransferase class V-fold PLP-dependent enzyme [Oscillospiraceae bacterium]
MIYLDNAATTYPKPQSVQRAVTEAFRRYGANPGRAGHSMAMAASEEIYRCRSAAADFFHAQGPECVAFTLNCTHAVNYVLKGLLRPGDHVVISCLEHNAVVRPVHALAENGVTFTEARVFPGDNDATVNAFRDAIQENTKLVLCTHASNVWGIRLPVGRIAALAHQYGIPMAVDSAQSAGVLPIHMEEDGIDYLCAAGHKGLYGPMGTGMLITSHGSGLATVIEGGTGTESMMPEQPSGMPERLESGTQNMPGIAGLRAGIEFVKKRGPEKIFLHEIRLLRSLHAALSSMEGVVLYTPAPDPKYFAPVLSFNLAGLPSETVGRELSRYGVAVRAGLHCAPAAHRFMGTLEIGAVRVCPSAFSTMADINGLIAALKKIRMKNYERMH